MEGNRKHRLLGRKAFVIFTLIFGVSLAHADIYKWVDAKGNVHFGDAPPQEMRARALSIQAEPPTSAGPSSPAASSTDVKRRQERLTKALEEERHQRETLAAQQKQKSEQHEHTCTRIKNRLEHFKRVRVFYDENPDGTVRYLSDKEGDAYRMDLQARYEKECG